MPEAWLSISILLAMVTVPIWAAGAASVIASTYYAAPSTLPMASPSIHPAFPTDVAHPGFTQPGAWPWRAQMDPLGVVDMDDNNAIQLHWLPKNATLDHATSDDIFRNLGTYTPYRPARNLFPETAKHAVLSSACKLKQVHLLYRHGARYPTDGPHKGPAAFGQRLADVQQSQHARVHGELAFLKNWTYQLGTALLVNQGGHDMFQAGSQAYYQYAALLGNVRPVIRTTSQRRMLDSARYWSLGFFGLDAADKVDLEVLEEAKHKNSTLSPKYTCKNARKKKFKFGRQLAATWKATYLPPITARFQSLTDNWTWTDEDVYAMMSLCAFETVGLGVSRFCPLFTKREWEAFQYTSDLYFQGDHGFMSPQGKAQGIGWVSELAARLKQEPWTGPVTSQNTTLDTNDTYFPVHQPIYVDFTHDTVLVGVLTALNLTQFANDFDATKPDPTRLFRTSHVTPFASRFVFEVSECGAESWVRLKINEAIVPLNVDQGCEPRPDGLCRLKAFLQHLDNAQREARFDLACFGKNGTDFVLHGPVMNGTVPARSL